MVTDHMRSSSKMSQSPPNSPVQSNRKGSSPQFLARIGLAPVEWKGVEDCKQNCQSRGVHFEILKVNQLLLSSVFYLVSVWKTAKNGI